MASDIEPKVMKYAAEIHYTSIGKVTSMWATLELIMQRMIWQLANIGIQEGACITAQIPNSARLMDAIISLVSFHKDTEKLVKHYSQLSEKIRILQMERNRVIHDPWSADKSTGAISRFEISAAKSLTLGSKQVSNSYLDALTERIRSVIVEFNELSDLTVSELKASLQVRVKAVARYYAMRDSKQVR
jgi:hypothetical protein